MSKELMWDLCDRAHLLQRCRWRLTGKFSWSSGAQCCDCSAPDAHALDSRWPLVLQSPPLTFRIRATLQTHKCQTLTTCRLRGSTDSDSKSPPSLKLKYSGQYVICTPLTTLRAEYQQAGPTLRNSVFVTDSSHWVTLTESERLGEGGDAFKPAQDKRKWFTDTMPACPLLSFPSHSARPYVLMLSGSIWSLQRHFWSKRTAEILKVEGPAKIQ